MARPPKYKTAKELQDKIDKYIKDPTVKHTISGLAYFLGFSSRQSFYDLEKLEEFSYTVKRARLFLESHYEELLAEKSYGGAIFALKNFGWEDTSSILMDDKRKTIADLFPDELDNPEQKDADNKSKSKVSDKEPS